MRRPSVARCSEEDVRHEALLPVSDPALCRARRAWRSAQRVDPGRGGGHHRHAAVAPLSTPALTPLRTSGQRAGLMRRSDGNLRSAATSSASAPRLDGGSLCYRWAVPRVTTAEGATPRSAGCLTQLRGRSLLVHVVPRLEGDHRSERVSVPKCSGVSRLRSLRSPLRGLDTSCALRCVGHCPERWTPFESSQDGIRVPMRGRRRHSSATKHCGTARRRRSMSSWMLLEQDYGRTGCSRSNREWSRDASVPSTGDGS